MGELSGRVAIITGGASGIGRALAEQFAARGGEVVIADRQAALAEEVAQHIRGKGGRATGVELDVRDLAAFERVVANTVRDAGRVDYLFNNAGIAVGGEVDSYEAEDWADVIDVNLRGVTNGVHAVYPQMIAQGEGVIVNTASMAGLVATPGNANYTATKHAVVALSRALRAEARRHNVRVAVLCPGAIRTPILTGGRFGRMRFKGLSQEALLAMWAPLRPMAPEVFAERALDAVLRNEAIMVLPRWWKAVWYLERISPTASGWLWSGVLERIRSQVLAAGGTTEPRRAPYAASPASGATTGAPTQPTQS